MESGLPSSYLYLIGIVLVLGLGAIAALVMRVIGTHIQRPRITQKQRHDLPPYLLQIYKEAIIQLAPAGFTGQHYQLSQEIVAHARSDKWGMVLVNRKTGVYAEISPASMIVDMPGYEVDFWSIAKDGTTLLTACGRSHAILGEIPGCTVHDPLAGSVLEQYQAHLTRQAIFREGKKLTLLAPETYIRLQQKLLDTYFLKLMKDGTIVSTGNNRFRLTLSHAFRLIRQMFRGELHLAKLARARLAKKYARKGKTPHPQNSQPATPAHAGDPANSSSSDQPAPNDYPVEAEVAAYMRLQSAGERKAVGMAGKLAMFVATITLSYFAFGLVFSANSVLILLGVILLHELGHIAAMAIFRYRDLQILFIPLLGAAALGKNENVAVWKQVMVYLMGPLPGIILGIVLIAVYHQTQISWLYETALIMLIINYMNLLPFMPLDGGHIIRLTIMERFPTGKLVFSIVSTAALALAGWLTGEPVLWVLAAVMFATLPLARLETAVMRSLNKEPASSMLPGTHDTNIPATEPHHRNNKENPGIQDRLTRIFNTLRKPDFRKLTFADKFNLIKSMSDVLLQQRHCSLTASLSLTGLYLVTLLLTPPAALLTAVGPDNFTKNLVLLSGGSPQPEWETEINRTTDPDQRFKLTLDAAQYYVAFNQLPEALTYLQQAKDRATLTNDDKELSRLYQSYSLYYQRKGDLTEAENVLQEAINIGVKSPNKDYPLITSHFQSLASLKFQQKDAKAFESNLLTALLFAKQISKPEERHVIVNILEQLLNIYYQLEQNETALLLLQQTLDELAPKHDPFSNYIARYAYQQLGWLYEDTGNSEMALKSFQQALQLNEVTTTTNNELSTQVNSISDPLENANILLAIAAVQYSHGNVTTAEIRIEQAEQLARANQFESLGQYIENYSPELGHSIDEEDSRHTIHWRLISDTYNSLRTQNDGTSDG